ncbi:MAG: C40 family peptidase [Lachnospiraceae bacterium]|nr:C40 family peptidase [Lachnospiraceae bacterium]
MKKVIIAGAVTFIAVSAAYTLPVHAEGTINSVIASVGVGEILELDKTEEEFKEAAAPVELYGYSNIGIADVDNHLNVRETPDENGKLVGKMSNNAACEILGTEGDWIQIESGKVKGYCHKDYLLSGLLARKRAEEIVTLVAEATSGGLRVRLEPNTDSEILSTMGEGETLEVLEELDGWIKVLIDDEEGYISSDYAAVKQNLDTAITMTELMYGEGVSDVRVELCQYAKQFIGNPYVWGGTSLTKGADCSGFTLSVFKKYGMTLPHHSGSQAQMGKKVSLSEAKAGDLVFYSNGKRVNHVAIYIGGGQVVHASNPRTGIRISNVNYRTIHSIRNIIGD